MYKYFLPVLATTGILVGSMAQSAPVVTHTTLANGPVHDLVTPLDYFSWLEGAEVSFNGGSETAIWAQGDGLWGSGSECGGVAVGGFSLGGCGDTFVENWYLENGSLGLLTDFAVNLLPIGHMFDRTLPTPGSIDSAAGLDFTFVSSSPDTDGSIRVLYSMDGVQTPDDLWGVMGVDLRGLTDLVGASYDGLISGGQLVFMQDTDARVPLPAAGWLLLSGAGALTAMRRRKRG